MTNIDHLLPVWQYGYRKGRSTEQAVIDVITKIKLSLQVPGGHYYGLFIDFTKAFDNVDRVLLLEKLKNLYGVRGCMLGSIASTLRGNRLFVTDGFSKTNAILQSKGVQQGDCLSPTLFIVYLGDLPAALEESGTDCSFYADDTRIGSPLADNVKKSLSLLKTWCDTNQIHVNVEKTKIVKFRRGGRLARGDVFMYGNDRVEVVSAYEYLGVTLQSRLTFTEHVQKVKRKAKCTIAALNDLHLVSVECAMKIFNMKILPTVTYCLKAYSKSLTVEQLIEIDKIKTAFVKRALCLHESASSTLALEMVNTDALCQQLEALGYGFDNDTWREYCSHREERILRCCVEYGSVGPAFTNQSWLKKKQRNRHVFTRSTVHGFHMKLCIFLNCRRPEDDCRCVLCGGYAPIYHLLECPALADEILTEKVTFLDSL